VGCSVDKYYSYCYWIVDVDCGLSSSSSSSSSSMDRGPMTSYVEMYQESPGTKSEQPDAFLVSPG
jgi:hypothetical protein